MYTMVATGQKICNANVYVREEELIKQLVDILDQLDLKESEVLKKYKSEMVRLYKFQKTILGVKEKAEPEKELDIKLYAKYILENGDIHERREFLSSVNSKILLTHKVLTVKHD